VTFLQMKRGEGRRERGDARGETREGRRERGDARGEREERGRERGEGERPRCWTAGRGPEGVTEMWNHRAERTEA